MEQKCAIKMAGMQHHGQSQVEMDLLWSWPHGEAGMMSLIITRRLSYVKQQETQESVLLGLPVNCIMIFIHIM